MNGRSWMLQIGDDKDIGEKIEVIGLQSERII